MTRAPAHTEAPGRDGLLSLGLLSIAVGAWTGLVVALFRLGVGAADRAREVFFAASHRWAGIGFAAVVGGCACAVMLARWLPQRFSPYAEGSGIPEVEVALQRGLPTMPLPRLLLIKFVGGLLAIGAGLALGPEGPSVQLGAVGARLISDRFRRGWPDSLSLIAAGTGAGLAVAFNAPIAGVVFVLEELHRRFDKREALAALGAASTAILVARVLLGNTPLFHLAATATGPLPYAAPAAWPLYLVLGILGGLAGAAYNRALVGTLALAERFDRRVRLPQALAVGGVVGVIGWFAPHFLGAGDTITQGILAGVTLVGAIPLVFGLRFLFGAASYGVRAPGGLFAPLMLLGAQLGFLWGALCRACFPLLGLHPEAFAVVGMAAFFTGVVRAPLTGIVLVIEMTAAFTSLLPMLVGCFAALAAADLVGSPPIYRTLSERLRDRVGGRTATVEKSKGTPTEGAVSLSSFPS